MYSSVSVKRNESIPTVISPIAHVSNPKAHYEDNGNVECGCGEVRYFSFDKCRKCGDREIAAYRIAEDQKPLLNSATAVKTRFWYHSTRVQYWNEKIKDAGVPVHLGNLTTAIDRANDEFAQGNFYPGHKWTYTIYKIMLNPFASISDVVCHDLVNDWSEDMTSFKEVVGKDFVRYINTFENPGSVSIFGDPRKFIVVGKSTHTAN